MKKRIGFFNSYLLFCPIGLFIIFGTLLATEMIDTTEPIQQKLPQMIIGIIFIIISISLFIMELAYFAEMDNNKIIMKRPFRKEFILFWNEVQEVEVVKIIWFRYIYISNFSAENYQKITMNCYQVDNKKMICFFYSRKKLQIIKEFYGKEIKGLNK